MKNIEIEKIGVKIRDLRIAKEMSQGDLAKAVEVKQSAISKYEKGIVYPSLEVLAKLSIVLDTTTDYLLGLTEFE